MVALLQGRVVAEGAEELVQVLERALGPDAETAELTTGGELEEVESGHVDNFNSGDVSESLDKLSVLVVVDDERALPDAILLVSGLADASSDGLVEDDLLDIFEGADSLEEGEGVFGFFNGLESVLNDERDLGDLRDAVAPGEDERNDAGGSDG